MSETAAPVSFAEAVAAFYRTVVPQPSVVDLAGLMARTLDARPLQRHAKHFRPSQLNNPYACHRRAALMRLEGIYTDRQREAPDKLLLMEEGTLLHGYVQTELLGPTKLLFGHWRCKSCRRVTHTYQTIPATACRNVTGVRAVDDDTFDPREETVCALEHQRLRAAGESPWEYVEMTLHDRALDLIGHVDGVLLDRADPRLWHTLELKTTGPLAMRGLDETKLTSGPWPGLPKALEGTPVLMPSRFKLPKAYHVAQGALYSEMIVRAAAAGVIPLSASGYQGTLVVYLNRDGLGVRTFIRRNSEAAMTAAGTTIAAILDVLERADRTERDDPVENNRRIEANRKLACELSMSCRDRTDDKALLCPWRTVVCFPYKVASKNKLEFLV